MPDSSPQLISVVRVWDHAKHNALTDLIFYQGRFFLCFRESNSHYADEDGKIRILSSADGITWLSEALIVLPGKDLRDPVFSVMPDGRLMLSMGGAVYVNRKFVAQDPCVAFSDDGRQWSSVHIIDLPGEWIWRVTWDRGVGFGASYSFTDSTDLDKPWILKLFKTTDGLNYTFVTHLDVPDFPSEATLRFLPDGSCVALVRRRGTGWMGVSSAPYHEWKWSEVGYQLGGPNFLILPNQEMWACSRRIKKSIFGKQHPSVVLARMGLREYTPVLTLPSGGDCSYPGMVYKNNKLYISYYSSHEGKTSVYFAEIEL